MTAAASTKATAETARDIAAELRAAQAALAAKEAARSDLDAGDEAALISDAAYLAHDRAKKLLALEIERLRKVVTDLKIEIDDELAQQELAAFEQKYLSGKSRRDALVTERFPAVREPVITLLKFALDLAQNDLDCAWINARVERDRRIDPADVKARCLPATGERVVSSETMTLWSAFGADVYPQSKVQVDDRGRGYYRSGDQIIYCTQQQFRRVEKADPQPAEGILPFWKLLQIPALVPCRDDYVYDGSRATTVALAIEMLRQAIDTIDAPYERPVSTSVKYELIDPDGSAVRAIRAADAAATPPAISEG